ncbi:MAG: PilZ domain-containing protein [Spirochaetota bacterium]
MDRFQISIPARLVVNNTGQQREVLELSTCNICARGAFFKTDHDIPRGTKVQLDFVLSIDRLQQLLGVHSYVSIKGKVVRSGLDGIAVKFNKTYELMPYRSV